MTRARWTRCWTSTSRRPGPYESGRGGNFAAAPPDRVQLVGVIVPKSPSASSLMPAVKNRVSGSPFAPPLPNSSAQRPSIESLPCGRGVERAAVLEVPVPHLLVGVDLPVAEVADQQVAAEPAERIRCPGEAPRSVELPVLGNPAEELPVAGRRRPRNRAPDRAPRRPIRAAASAYVTKTRSPIVWIPKGAKSLGSLGVDKRSGSVHLIPAAVEHVDPALGEVRRVQPRAGRAIRDGETLEHGPRRRHVHRDERSRRAAAPRADGPVLAVEDEVRRPERRRASRRPDLELACDPGEHRAGRSARNALSV